MEFLIVFPVRHYIMAHIRTYARIKPTKNAYNGLDTTDNKVYLRMPEGGSTGPSQKLRHSNNPATHAFQFNNVFNVKVAQQEVFDGVAKEIVNGV